MNTPKHWTEDNEQKRTFHTLSYLIMAKSGIIPADPRYMKEPWKSEAYTQALDEFRKTTGLEQYPDIAAGVDALKAWAKQRVGIPQHADNRVKVSVSVTRHYGDISIAYGLECDYLLESIGMITIAYEELREIIEAQHDLAAMNRPALMPTKNTQAMTESRSGQVSILCTHVRKEFAENKLRIRLIGGEFTKFGIPVYDEFMEALGIVPDALEWGDTPYGKNVVVQLDGKGNPKRAIAIG